MNPDKIFLKLLTLWLLTATVVAQNVDSQHVDNDNDVGDVVGSDNVDVVDEDNEVGVDAGVGSVVTDGDKSYDSLLETSEEYQPIDPVLEVATSSEPASPTEGKIEF